MLQFTLAVVFLFATFASQAKIAFAFAAIVVGYWMVNFSIVYRYRSAALCLVVLVVGIGAYNLSVITQAGSRWKDVGTAVSSNVAISQFKQPDTATVRESAVPEKVQKPDAPTPKEEYNPATATQQDKLDMADIEVIQDRTQRIKMFRAALAVWLDHKLFGAGFGTYSVRLRNSESTGFEFSDHPHSIALEMLSTTGLIGAALWTISIFICFVAMHQIIRMDVNWIFMAGYPVSVLLSGMFAGDVFDFRGFYFVTLVMTCAFAGMCAEHKKEIQRLPAPA